MKQYAHMVGAICLDKSQDDFGQPAPVTFSVRKVVNGAQPWQQGNGNTTFYRGAETLEKAIVELHSLFQREMEERGHALMIDRISTYEDLQEDGESFQTHLFVGQSGWYENPYEAAISNRAEYAVSDYPLLASEWVARGITSYAYDNYKVCIVTSAGSIVY